MAKFLLMFHGARHLKRFSGDRGPLKTRFATLGEAAVGVGGPFGNGRNDHLRWHAQPGLWSTRCHRLHRHGSCQAS
jgi:hypothetical protein